MAKQCNSRNTIDSNIDVPQKAINAVLLKSKQLPKCTPKVRGYDFNNGVDFNSLLNAYKFTGFQATNFGEAVDRINEMISWRLSDDEINEDDLVTNFKDRENIRCSIFLGLTSNMISSGTREIIRYLVEHKMVDFIVTTAGGIEEDLMKCFKPHLIGDFSLSGIELRKSGINRLGNLLIPNDNYCYFEEWIVPILDAMYKEQNEQGILWTPSKMIRRLGKEINNPESV